MDNRWMRALAAASCALALAACARPGPAPSESADDLAGYRACLLTVQDGGSGLNRMASAAMASAEVTNGVSAVAKQTTQATAAADAAALAGSCDLVIGVGPALDKPLRAVAREHPGLSVAIVDGPYTGLDDTDELPGNYKPVLFASRQAAYEAGYAAATMTKTGVVAAFGGQDLPGTRDAMTGFVAGVEARNAQARTHVSVLGWNPGAGAGSFTGSQTSVPAARQMTHGLAIQGADVILAACGEATKGAFAAAAAEGGVRVIGMGPDWAKERPGEAKTALTSVITDAGAAIQDVIGQGANGLFTATPYVGDLHNGGVRLAELNAGQDGIPSELAGALASMPGQITSGQIVIPAPAATP